MRPSGTARRARSIAIFSKHRDGRVGLGTENLVVHSETSRLTDGMLLKICDLWNC